MAVVEGAPAAIRLFEASPIAGTPPSRPSQSSQVAWSGARLEVEVITAILAHVNNPLQGDDD
jgi:hypothetical protein